MAVISNLKDSLAGIYQASFQILKLSIIHGEFIDFHELSQHVCEDCVILFTAHPTQQ